MKFFYGLIIFMIFENLSVQSTPFEKCDVNNAPLELRVDKCNTSPCAIRKGTSFKAEWDFVVNKDTKILKPRVYFMDRASKIQLPFPQRNACAGLQNARCPLKVGQKVTYKFVTPAVPKSIPNVKGKIQVTFSDDKGKICLCFRTAIYITD